MTWILILTLTYNGQTTDLPWALTPDAQRCAWTGQALVLVLRPQLPGVTVQFSCAPEVAA